MEIGNDLDPHYPEHWPLESDLPGFRTTMKSFHLACHELHLKIMQLLAIALDLEPDYFESSISSRSHCLRLLHYPPTRRPEGNTRIGSHTDFGTVRVSEPSPFSPVKEFRALMREVEKVGYAALARFDWRIRSCWTRWRMGESDSQTRHIRHQHVRFLSLSYHPLSQITHCETWEISGDILSRWSNDKLKSTIHRAVLPDPSTDDPVTGKTRTRRSIAYFCNVRLYIFPSSPLLPSQTDSWFLRVSSQIQMLWSSVFLD